MREQQDEIKRRLPRPKGFKIEVRKLGKVKDRLRFRNYEDIASFEPKRRIPLPKPTRIRYLGKSWVRCVNNEMVGANFCHDSFVERNAMYQKGHPCFNCPLGKNYRAQFAEESYKDEREEAFQ